MCANSDAVDAEKMSSVASFGEFSKCYSIAIGAHYFFYLTKVKALHILLSSMDKVINFAMYYTYRTGLGRSVMCFAD